MFSKRNINKRDLHSEKTKKEKKRFEKIILCGKGMRKSVKRSEDGLDAFFAEMSRLI